MSRIGMLFRKLTPLDIMMADLEAAQMNRVLAAKELEYLKAMERLYIERIERLSSEIKAIQAISAPAQEYDGVGVVSGVMHDRRTAPNAVAPALVVTPACTAEGVRNVRF